MKGNQAWITQNYGSRGYHGDEGAGTKPDLIVDSSFHSPTVGVIFLSSSFPSKDLPMSCLSSMLTKLREEETYGETPVNEGFFDLIPIN